MAFYLVRATPVPGRLADLREKLADEAFVDLEPFGEALTHSLKNARKNDDGQLVWEEEDYCSPPLREEREAVLDEHFRQLELERVSPGEGWESIDDLPSVFPELSDESV